jgi:hypothetical protein
MGVDKRLTYPPDAGGLGAPTWPTPDTGQEAVYSVPVPAAISGHFDRAGGNGVVIPRYVGTENFKTAVPRVLGYSASGGPNGTLVRVLPVGDGQGLGMIANRVVDFHLIGETGKKITPGDVDANAPTMFNYDGGGPPDISTTAFKGKRYTQLAVEFVHPPYRVLSDVNAVANALAERSRFCWTEVIDSLEYNTSEGLVLEWDAAAPLIPGRSIATGPGFPRPGAEVVVHWERIPVDALVLLLAKYINNNIYGKINNAPFVLPFFNLGLSYPAESLMFMSARPQLRFQPHGPIEYDLEIHFQLKTNGGWNYYQEPSGTFQRMRRRLALPGAPGNGPDVFAQVDFEQIFKAN